jgi:hypothetical protein
LRLIEVDERVEGNETLEWVHDERGRFVEDVLLCWPGQRASTTG